MRRKITGMTAAMAAVMLLAGCGSDVELPLNQMKVEKYVTLGDYRNLSVNVDAAAVDEAELYTLTNSVYLGGISAEYGGIVDRAVQAGDTVIIDYEGKKDGVAFEGGTAQGASLTIGSGQFIAGFEDGLIGVMPGETMDLNLSFPENFRNTELAGQAVVFTVTVHYIIPSEVAPEDMEDAVAAAVGIEGVTTVEELSQYVYDYLYSVAEENYRYDVRDGIMSALMEQCTFQEIPEAMIEPYREMISASIERTAAAYGVTADVYASYFFNGMSSAELVDTYAQTTLQQDMLMQAIANAEGLNVDDAELQSLLEEQAQAAGAASVEEYIGDLSMEDYRNYFMSEKVMEYLIGQTNIIENK